MVPFSPPSAILCSLNCFGHPRAHFVTFMCKQPGTYNKRVIDSHSRALEGVWTAGLAVTRRVSVCVETVVPSLHLLGATSSDLGIVKTIIF